MHTSVLRQAVATLLLVVLTLAGVGQAMASSDVSAGSAVEIAGVAVQLCHPGSGDPSAPVGPGHHDCCDTCGLCAPVALPDAAPFVAPIRVEHVAAHAVALFWSPTVARVPTPRLSQGPPAA